jgi:transcription antitermination factor NusG
MIDQRQQELQRREIQRRALQGHRRVSQPGRQRRLHASFWGLVRTPVGREKFARLNIEKGGNKCFVPKVYDGKRGASLSPLFPGYVFVWIEHRQWMHVQYSPGVIAVIKDRGQAARVPEVIMDQLISEQGDLGYIDLARARYKPEINDRIKIKAGLFKDHVASYIGLSPDARVRALIRFLGSDTEVQVRRRDIEPA